MDIYSTRAQLAAIDLMEPEYSFLYDMFVSDMGAVEDEKAIYDYRKGKLQMAPVVHEMTGGVLMGRTGYETRGNRLLHGCAGAHHYRPGHHGPRVW